VSIASGIIFTTVWAHPKQEEDSSLDPREWLQVLEDTLEKLPVTNENYQSERRSLEQAIVGIAEHKRAVRARTRWSFPDLINDSAKRNHNILRDPPSKQKNSCIPAETDIHSRKLPTIISAFLS
jgi:hypothetical protein